MADLNRPYSYPKELSERAQRKLSRNTPPDVLWYSRCPVPTPLGLAARLGWFEQEFRADAITIQAVPDLLDSAFSASYEDHQLYGSFRQGSNVPALWAKAGGADTLLLGLNWLDEAQLVVVKQDSAIQSLTDLAAKKLALPLTNRPIDTARASTLRGFSNVLKLAEVPQSCVLFVDHPFQLNPTEPLLDPVSACYASLASALQRQEVDAVFVKGAKGMELASQTGYRVLYDLRHHPDPFIRANNSAPRPITVDAALWRDQPQLVLRFLDRILDVEDFAANHQQAVYDYVAQESRSTAEWVRQAYGSDLHLRQGISLALNQLSALSDYKDFLVEQGFLVANFDLADWIEPAPLKILQAERARRRAMQRHQPDLSMKAAIGSLW
jgi:ABC-type nitrate/sulfonate/bicarbonate transport system substrate-binding protein